MNLETGKTVYIAGPMTGLPQFNIPAFNRATARLRAAGYVVISPVELDSPAVQGAALASKDGKLDAGGKIAGESWGEILARDVRVVADHADAICVLPGWERSRGARLEVFVALLCKKPVYRDIHYGESGSGDPLGMMPPHLAQLSTYGIVFELMRSFLES